MLNSLQGPNILSNLFNGCTHDLSFNARRRKNRRVRNCSVSIKAQVKKKKQKSKKKTYCPNCTWPINADTLIGFCSQQQH